jgi:hypothetical protein
VPSYVAYTNGLGATEDNPDGIESGAAVSPGDFDVDEWTYHIMHGNVVRAGSPNDPNVLAAADEEEIPEDPKDRRIKDLEAQLLLFAGRPGTPAPSSHLDDLAQVKEKADDKEKAPERKPAQGRPS